MRRRLDLQDRAKVTERTTGEEITVNDGPLFVETAGRISVFLGKACGMFYLAAIGLSVAEVVMR